MLVVDAGQGVEAQTVANAYPAIENNPRAAAGREQDRPAAGRSRPRGAGARRVDRRRSRRRLADLGQDRPGRPGGARRGDRAHPTARGRPLPPAPLIFDSSYDQYRGVVASCGSSIAPSAPPSGCWRWRRGRGSRRRSSGSLADHVRERNARSRRGRLRDHRPQGRQPPARGRHAHLSVERPAAAPLTGYKDVKPMVRGPLPDGLGRLSQPPRRAREAETQRRRARLRARDVPGARLRVPLRLPRAAAHGDRARAARAGVRPRSAGDRAERRLPRADEGGRGAGGPQPGRDAGRGRAGGRASTSAPRSSSRRSTSGR